MNPEWKLGSNQNDLRSYGMDNKRPNMGDITYQW